MSYFDEMVKIEVNEDKTCSVGEIGGLSPEMAVAIKEFARKAYNEGRWRFRKVLNAKISDIGDSDF